LGRDTTSRPTFFARTAKHEPFAHDGVARALGAPVQNFAALFYSSLAEGRHGCEISNIGMVSLPKLWAFQ